MKAEALMVELWDVMEVSDVRGIYKIIFIASARILRRAKRSNWIIKKKMLRETTLIIASVFHRLK